jgi:hypothetical protein
MPVHTAYLVYQVGIANVFAVNKGDRLKASGRHARRLVQGSFRDCEWYCRGLIAAGVTVRVAHCNQAGDVSRSDWSADLDDAPFRSEFRIPADCVA